MSDNIGQKEDALRSYTSLYNVGSPEAADVYRRYETVKRINEAQKQISKETKAPRQTSKANIATMRLILAERSK